MNNINNQNSKIKSGERSQMIKLEYYFKLSYLLKQVENKKRGHTATWLCIEI